MKTPTTPHTIEIESKRKINRKFLELKGFELELKAQLFDIYRHKKNKDVRCSIGLYGQICIQEFHWINKDEPMKQFSTTNINITEDEFNKIIELLNINI